MTGAVHPVDEMLPVPRLFALGLQHVLVMYANAVAVPLILGGALHLPKEQIAMLINADLYSPPARGAVLPTPTAAMRTLYQNMRKQKLDVAQHVPIHGRVGTNDEFLKIVGQSH